MKEKPILFSTDMVKALFAGRKTMTRRIVKMYATDNNPIRQNAAWLQENKTCPYGQVGDVLWVREKFGYSNEGKLHFATNVCNPKYDKPSSGWKPSIHMPKYACRIFLQITNVRVERLKDISEEDAIAEGIEKQFSHLFQEWRYKDYAKVKDDWRSPISSFQSLWASLNGFDSWDENPWVWVIEFKRVNKPNND
jgi:hypothetical protein